MRIGDVYRYDTDNNERHCREGISVVVPGFDGEPALVDTFWASLEEDLSVDLSDGRRWNFLGTAHRLTDTERAGAALQCNLNDFTAMHRFAETDAYEPGDIVCITAQNGLVRHYYLRDGAERSNRVIMQHQRALVDERERAIESAQHGYEHAQAQLKMMEALVEAGEQL